MSSRTPRAAVVALVTFATFTDIVTYSVAVPILPDLSHKLSASPTMIGLLFASFGVTLLTVSVPMGAVSDRIGRKAPLIGGMVALTASTVLFAFANGLPLLFAARLAQGAADAVTWVVGFALIADLYVQERGRITGIVMAGTSFAVMIGPTLGGWLYELGGMRLPFLVVALMAAASAASFSWLSLPPRRADADRLPFGAIVRVPAIAICAAAVAMAAAMISMLEPVMSLQLHSFGVKPARVGLVFGAAAVATAILHPFYGRLADRYGGRRLTMIGLVVSAGFLPVLARAWSFESALVLYVVQAAAVALVVTPSLAYMADAIAEAGVGSFGVAYGLYNVAWGVGLLGGPALGGFMYERLGFPLLALTWSPCVIALVLALTRVQSQRSSPREPV